MQTLIRIFAILIIVGLPLYSMAASFYVKNAGSDAADGLSDGNAWETIGKLNGYDFADGDVIYFNKGDTWDDAILTFAAITGSGKEITVDSYGTGAKPIFDGNAVQPMRITNTSLDTINVQNIQVVGLDFVHWTEPFPAGYGHIWIDNIDNILLDSVDFNGHTGTSSYRYKDFFFATNEPEAGGSIEVKNCTLTNLRPNDDPTQWDGGGAYSEDWNGLGDSIFVHIGRQSTSTLMTSGTVSIHDNTMTNTWADGIHLKNIQVPAVTNLIYNNTITGYGENAIDLKDCRYTDIYNNIFNRNGYGFGGYPIGGGVADIVAHDNGDAGTPTHSYDLTIRENYMTSDAVGVRLIGHTYNSTVRHNKIEAGCNGIIVDGDASDGNEILNNEIRITGTAASISPCFAAGIVFSSTSPTTDVDNTLIYGNTVFIYNDDGFHGLSYYTDASMSGNIIKNNAFYTIRNSSTSYPLRIVGAGTGATIDYNSYYSSQNTNRVNDDGTLYTTANFSTWTAAGHTNDRSSDPGFVSTTQLWPDDGTDDVVGNGEDLGSSYDDLLDPDNTDFSASPPSVTTEAQPGAWLIGAYGLTGSEVRTIIINSW